MTAAITDFSQFHSLRAASEDADPGVLREVAGQFEALFVDTLMRNMRASSLGDPVTGKSHQQEMYQGMLDQQFALEMSKGPGLGIADMLVRQLGGEDAMPSGVLPTGLSLRSFAVERSTAAHPDTRLPERWDDPVQFARDVWPHAERAGRALGVAPEALLAQAALETGWGTHVPRHADGSSSLNLFGIKAGRSWDGDRVAVPTLEFRGGVAQRETAKFRAYPNLGSTFDDYVRVIAGQTRYEAVLGSGADTGRFASELQQAGYATDPRYADKIQGVVESPTMQQAMKFLKFSAELPIRHATAQSTGRS